MPVAKDIGAVIKKRMVELGLNQSSLEQKTGRRISQSTISEVIRNITDPSRLHPNKLEALLNGLEWTLDEFRKHTGLSIDVPLSNNAQNGESNLFLVGANDLKGIVEDISETGEVKIRLQGEQEMFLRENLDDIRKFHIKKGVLVTVIIKPSNILLGTSG